ncbi:MAG: class I SAM-dependent methyltransferase [Clostridiales Family XIII bacterium]|jgi:SAM-dependent methyltransferase|nr:class I SAM-dependent methyltransferase [Clostridiales Family XIII bacterium]
MYNENSKTGDKRTPRFNWKAKAFIQNFIAMFPKSMSYELYFQMQRHFGGYKKPYDPLGHFETGVDLIKKIQKYGYDTDEKVFFEVGTGRVPLLPIAFWLCGAGKTITVDLNPYVRKELIEDALFVVNKEKNEIKSIFGNLLNEDRFELLLDYAKSKKINKEDILQLCEIEYIAPGDASKTKLKDNSVDYHISHTVYEHIPLNIIKDILKEGNRIITRDGLFINYIDYRDHFAQMDKSISVINFLQYNDKDWDKYAGNRYMYMNRARHDEFMELFEKVGHDFMEIEPDVDEDIQEMLNRGGAEIMIDKKFEKKSNEILSITGSWFVTKQTI